MLLLFITSVRRLQAHPGVPTGPNGVAAEFGGAGATVEDGITRRQLHCTMIAVILVVRINQLKEVRQLILVAFRMRAVAAVRVFLVYQPLNILVEDHSILGLDELVALFEAAGQKADVFETLAVEHFDDELEDLVVEVADVQVVVGLTCLLAREWTLPKVRRSQVIAGFVEIAGHFLGIEAKQTNVHLVLTVIEALPYLVQQISLITTVGNLKLCATWQHRFFLEHQSTAVDYNQPQILVMLFRVNGHTIGFAIFAKLGEGRSIWEASMLVNIVNINTKAFIIICVFV